MPTPERNIDRLSPSRRNYEQQQQEQQSPFRRARIDSRPVRDSRASHITSPSYKYDTQHRGTFSRTNTLTGAWRTTAHAPMAENEGVSTAAHTRETPSPLRRYQSYNRFSPESNPPNELVEAYRQIDDADSLVDIDPEDDYHPQGERDGRSPGYPARDYDIFTTSDASFLDEDADESPRRRLSDHVQDERRLRRATTSHSPVLSTRVGTRNSLTAEDLQRRKAEDKSMSEEEDGLEHPLNLPSTWGSRARMDTNNWIHKFVRRDEPKQRAEGPVETSPPRPATGFDFGFRTSPGRATELTTSRYSRVPLSDAQNKLPGEKVNKRIRGNPEPIANTPITVYKNSSFNKPSPSKRDSHDLLRKLARQESPDQNRTEEELRTPEAPKIGQRRIYDKTPVVTGAWIDTPMTERVSDRVVGLPQDLTTDIISVPAVQIAEPAAPQMYGESKNESEKNEAAREREHREEQEREKEREQARRLEEQEKERIAEEEKTKEREREEHEKSEELEKKTKAPLIKPDLPKSGLETVMQEHRADKQTLDVGDDTLESLQEMLKEESVEPKADVEDDAAYEKSVVEKLKRAQGEKDLGDSKIGEKLLSLEGNQDSLRKKIDGVEEQMTQKISQVSSRPSPSPPEAQPKPKRIHTGKKCETCGAEDDGRIYASIPLPLLWRRDPVSRRIRPTRLGWCLLLSLLWFVSESRMCDYYCHPTVASVCKGNCLRRDAPRSPFVIPTMLWRWSHLSAALAPLATVGIAFLRLLAQLLGLWDGYVDVPPRTLNLSGEVRIYGTRISYPPVMATTTPGFFARQWPAKEPTYTPEAVYTPQTVPEPRSLEEEPRAAWDNDSMDDDVLL